MPWIFLILEFLPCKWQLVWNMLIKIIIINIIYYIIIILLFLLLLLLLLILRKNNLNINDIDMEIDKGQARMQ